MVKVISALLLLLLLLTRKNTVLPYDGDRGLEEELLSDFFLPEKQRFLEAWQTSSPLLITDRDLVVHEFETAMPTVHSRDTKRRKDVVSQWMSLDDVPIILNQPDHERSGTDMIRFDFQVFSEREEMYKDSASAMEAFSLRNYTIIINYLQRRWNPAFDVSRSLAALLPSSPIPINTNLYVTPPNSKAFANHFDDEDIFIVQIHGSKQWRVAKRKSLYWDNFCEGIPAPVVDDVEDYFHLTLQPGDVLYIPRGIRHDASTTGLGEASMHWTLGLESRCDATIGTLLHHAVNLLWHQTESANLTKTCVLHSILNHASSQCGKGSDIDFMHQKIYVGEDWNEIALRQRNVSAIAAYQQAVESLGSLDLLISLHDQEDYSSSLDQKKQFRKLCLPGVPIKDRQQLLHESSRAYDNNVCRNLLVDLSPSIETQRQESHAIIAEYVQFAHGRFRTALRQLQQQMEIHFERVWKLNREKLLLFSSHDTAKTTATCDEPK